MSDVGSFHVCAVLVVSEPPTASLAYQARVYCGPTREMTHSGKDGEPSERQLVLAWLRVLAVVM